MRKAGEYTQSPEQLLDNLTKAFNKSAQIAIDKGIKMWIYSTFGEYGADIQDLFLRQLTVNGYEYTLDPLTLSPSEYDQMLKDNNLCKWSFIEPSRDYRMLLIKLAPI